MKWVFPDETVPYSQHNVSVCAETPLSGNISWAAAVKFRLFNQQIIFFQSCAAVLNCGAESRENVWIGNWRLPVSVISWSNQDNRKPWWFRVGTEWAQFPFQVQHPQTYPTQGGFLPVLLIKIAPSWRWTFSIRAQPFSVSFQCDFINLATPLTVAGHANWQTHDCPGLYKTIQVWFCLIQTEINTSVSLKTATKRGFSYFLILEV